jgi:hypothetical protein
VEQIGDRLYALPPEQFIAARDEAVAAARKSGDRALAEAVGALRKPTVAAWLVNLLALRRPDLVDELFELGEALRRAQHELEGEQLRELSTQRRAVVSALTAEAGRLAGEARGTRREDLPLAEVETTLAAALADEEAAQRVREGRLQRSVTYTGFGETPKPQLRVIAGGEPAPKRPARPSNAEQELAAARTRMDEAQTALDRAAAAEQEAGAALAELTSALEDLRRRHAAAQTALSEAQLRHKGAQRAAQAAARQLTTAQQRVDRRKDR